MVLSEQVISQNYDTFHEILEKYFEEERLLGLKKLYKDLEERLLLQPASPVEHMHNCFPGGYLDHILRVVDFSLSVYKFYDSCGMNIEGFTKEELVFVALNHDLGKLGYPGEGNETYLPNDSKWHKEKLGQLYKINEDIDFAKVPDRSLFLLQNYNIPMSWNEWLGIKIHDGIYDEANKPYFFARKDYAKLKNNLVYIVHTADAMAARFEWERWKDFNETKEDFSHSKSKSKKAMTEKAAQDFQKLLEDF